MSTSSTVAVTISPERMKKGAENAALLMGVGPQDRVFILTDRERQHIAALVAEAAQTRGGQVTTKLLEDYGARPLTAFPAALRADIEQINPTVSYYIATAKPGEIGFRIPFIPYMVKERQVRHGHMIGITDELMCEGMCADYDEVYRVTNQVYNIVKDAKTIRVTSAKGSDVTATFDPSLHWVPCHGRYTEQGLWGNLPEGETFTSPATLDGTLVVDLLGDFFSAKYGILEQPAIFHIKDSYITDIECANHELTAELRRHFWSVPNGNRAGEFAIGTLTSLTRLTGNLLQDEKMPGLHVAFGNPYPQFTGTDWTSSIHVDVIPTTCTIEVDGRTIMKDGAFTL